MIKCGNDIRTCRTKVQIDFTAIIRLSGLIAIRDRLWEPRGGGGDSSMKCPEECIGGLKIVPIMKDALGQKNIPILKGSSTH